MAPSTLLNPPTGRPGLRRLSSQTATEKEITSGKGPVVVVPERMMAQRTTSTQGRHAGFAESMETAKHKLDQLNLEDDVLASPDESSSPEEPSSVSAAHV
jgi:hypothetical protein